jgi:hypothetical protein
MKNLATLLKTTTPWIKSQWAQRTDWHTQQKYFGSKSTETFWDRCYDFLNIFAEKFSEKNCVLTQNKAKLCKILIITLVFEKNANFFAENSQKSQKIVIITSVPARRLELIGPAIESRHGGSFERWKIIQSGAGLPDFSWSKIPKRGRIKQINTKYVYQMTIKFSKWP